MARGQHETDARAVPISAVQHGPDALSEQGLVSLHRIYRVREPEHLDGKQFGRAFEAEPANAAPETADALRQTKAQGVSPPPVDGKGTFGGANCRHRRGTAMHPG